MISRVCIVGNCWQWVNFTMGTNEQNQHFLELRQKVCLYIHVVLVAHQRGLPSLHDKLERFAKRLSLNSSQTDYSCIFLYYCQIRVS